MEDAVLVRVDAELFVRRLKNQFDTRRAAEYVSIMYFLAQRMQAYCGDTEFYNAGFYLREVENLIDELQQALVVCLYYVIITFAFFGIVAFGNDA